MMKTSRQCTLDALTLLLIPFETSARISLTCPRCSMWGSLESQPLIMVALDKSIFSFYYSKLLPGQVCLEGWPDHLLPVHNVTAWQTTSSIIVGKMVATVLVQRGQPPAYFAGAVTDFLCFEEQGGIYTTTMKTHMQNEEFWIWRPNWRPWNGYLKIANFSCVNTEKQIYLLWYRCTFAFILARNFSKSPTLTSINTKLHSLQRIVLNFECLPNTACPHSTCTINFRR